MAITIEIRAFFSPLNDIAMPDAIWGGVGGWMGGRVGEVKGRWMKLPLALADHEFSRAATLGELGPL